MRSTRLACAALAALVLAGAAAAASDRVQHRRVLLGRSVEGRAIVATEIGDFDSPRKALVVGCVHGDECAGVAVAELLSRLPAPHELDLWLVPSLNPDGAAAGTRGNAHGVDLNRNFPWRWRRLTGPYDSGPHALSEPESRVAYRLLSRVRPSVAVWFHQHMNLVDVSSGNLDVERRFAEVARLRTARLAREPGSVVTWESHRFPRSTAFVVELPAGRLSGPQAARLAHAVTAAATHCAGLDHRDCG